jgi:hypothetical protein
MRLVIQKLLAEGMAEVTFEMPVSELNELLRPIQYEAVQWPDKSCIVLKDMLGSCTPSFPWTGTCLSEAKEVLKQIIHRQPVTSDVASLLVENKWIEDINGELVLSKRALVQHRDYILKLGGRYKECSICSFLVDGAAVHSYCQELLEKKKKAAAGTH